MTFNRIIAAASAAALLAGCASGSAIVTGTARAPIAAGQVKLYTDAPRRYDTIGIVRASSDAGWTAQGSQDYAIRELKEQAAKLGANGVLIVSTGERLSGLAGGSIGNLALIFPTTARTVEGRAIHVQEP